VRPRSANARPSAPVGLAILATAAAARTAHAGGSLTAGAALTAGYRLSFLIATGIAVLAAAFVAIQLRGRAGYQELPVPDGDAG
jgi:hypothetical protein